MLDSILFFLHYILLLFLGILLSISFSDVRMTRRTNHILCGLFLFCGTGLLIVYLTFDLTLTWQLYPMIVHLPLGIIMHALLKRRIAAILASIATAYLCCQPAKWFGILFETLSHNSTCRPDSKNHISPFYRACMFLPDFSHPGGNLQ